MYYVIKKQTNVSLSTFIGFKVPKYIAARNNDNVIFEFIKDGKPLRKWVKKEDIILLTEDKDFFLKTLNKFQDVEETQKQLIEDAKKQLEASMESFSDTMNEEIKNFEELRCGDDVPCILKLL